ncbi:hypothetical protein MN116_008597 [Schistosoma mekongi]|uniref:Uncharacterized protein n=1 Tax=Schistosoma mekongi TaxID=38744 RepID=A0AAE1Z5L6_SCHME|nr:hypothetical protein MN116_008597 [Schistosoma mekongi]
MIIISMNERNSIIAQNFTNTYVTNTSNTTSINDNNNTNITNHIMDNNLSTGALVGLIIGLVIITTILVIIIFWCIRVRHLYLSQRHTKMYDPDMFQNSQVKNDTRFSYSSTSHQPISSFPVLPDSSNLQNKPMNSGQNTSLANLQHQFLYPNVNYSTYNNYTTENPLKMNTSMNVGSGDRTSCATISSQSPSWIDHHYFNTHHFNSAALFDGTSFNFYPYNQQATTVMMSSKSISPISPITTNEPKCNSIHIHPLESNSYIDPSPPPSGLSHSRLKSIAFISHLNAFGLKNKRRFSHLTKKSNKLKDNTTNRNIDSSHNYYNNGQTNPLPITENHESYSNANILPDYFNFNTTESYDNDYFLYSLQTAIFNGFIPLSASDQQNTFHDYYKMSSPHAMSITQTPFTTATTTTPTIHEEFSHSFGEDLSLGNNNNILTSPLSEYDSSKRNSRTFSPDFKQFSYNSTNSNSNNTSSNNNRFRFPPPGPPVAGWVNQLILKTNNHENSLTSLSNVANILQSSSPTPKVTTSLENERRICKLDRKQSDTPVALYNAPVPVITMIDIVNMSSSISIPNRSISSVPPSPQHIPFNFVHSSRSSGLTTSNIIPRRHAATKYTQKELPLIGNSRIKSIQTNSSSLLRESDFVVASNNSPITLTNTLRNNNDNTVLFHNLNNDSSNVTTDINPDNENNIMPVQLSLSPLSYYENQHSDSGYHDSIMIADQSLLFSSSSVDHSLDLQQSPTFLPSLQQYDLSPMNLLDNVNNFFTTTTTSTTTATLTINTTETVVTSTTTAETMTLNAIFSETIDMLNNHSLVDKHIDAHNNTNNQFVYSKLEMPIPVTQSISVSLSSTSSSSSSSSSTTSSFSSPRSGPSSANSTTVMLRDNPNVRRKLSNPNITEFNKHNHQTIFRSPSDPDVFYSFCDESINKSMSTQPIPSYDASNLPSDHHRHHHHHCQQQQQQHEQHFSSIPLSRTNFAPNGMMKLMMMSTLSDSFKYHLNRQKSESQLLTDRHDSFDDIPWDIQLTPLY